MNAGASTPSALVPLAKLVRFRNGKSIKPGGEGPYAAFGSNGIIGRSQHFMYRNAIILGRVGAYCGSVAYCPDAFWASDNTIVVEPDPEIFDTRYAYYALTDAKLSQHAGGAAQPLVTQTVLKDVRIPLPALEIQRRIAGLLGAYDDLIDLNTRRIVILEEMARRLFVEWLNQADADQPKAISVPVGQIVTESLGGDWGTEQPEGDQTEQVRIIRGTDIPDLTTGNFERCPTRYISSKSFGRRALVPGDIIVENSINAKSRPAGTAFRSSGSGTTQSRGRY
jgi:restriction endonuclease S subunit